MNTDKLNQAAQAAKAETNSAQARTGRTRTSAQQELRQNTNAQSAQTFTKTQAFQAKDAVNQAAQDAANYVQVYASAYDTFKNQGIAHYHLQLSQSQTEQREAIDVNALLQEVGFDPKSSAEILEKEMERFGRVALPSIPMLSLPSSIG